MGACVSNVGTLGLEKGVKGDGPGIVVRIIGLRRNADVAVLRLFLKAVKRHMHRQNAVVRGGRAALVSGGACKKKGAADST